MGEIPPSSSLSHIWYILCVLCPFDRLTVFVASFGYNEGAAGHITVRVCDVQLEVRILDLILHGRRTQFSPNASG